MGAVLPYFVSVCDAFYLETLGTRVLLRGQVNRENGFYPTHHDLSEKSSALWHIDLEAFIVIEMVANCHVQVLQRSTNDH
jgi:hypothetical protein